MKKTLLVVAAFVATAGGAQPPAEGSFGRGPVPRAVQMTGAGDYVTSAVVHPHDTFDFDGIQFFELSLGSPTHGNGTRIVLSADGELEVARWLQKHARERISITLRAGGPMSRDGQ